MAAMTSLNLVELVQTLEEQQEQYSQMTQTISRTLQEQQSRQRDAADAIAGTLERISGLLSQLLGGGAPAGRRFAAPARSQSSEGHGNAVSAGAPAKGKGKGRGRGRGRGKYPMSGSELVLSLVQARKNPTSAELAQEWNASGRNSKVDNTLGMLVKTNKLKRLPNPGGRGSRYSLA